MPRHTCSNYMCPTVGDALESLLLGKTIARWVLPAHGSRKRALHIYILGSPLFGSPFGGRRRSEILPSVQLAKGTLDPAVGERPGGEKRNGPGGEKGRMARSPPSWPSPRSLAAAACAAAIWPPRDRSPAHGSFACTPYSI